MDCRTAWLGCPPPGTAGHTKVHYTVMRGLCISSQLRLQKDAGGDLRGRIFFLKVEKMKSYLVQELKSCMQITEKVLFENSD